MHIGAWPRVTSHKMTSQTVIGQNYLCICVVTGEYLLAAGITILVTFDQLQLNFNTCAGDGPLHVLTCLTTVMHSFFSIQKRKDF